MVRKEKTLLEETRALVITATTILNQNETSEKQEDDLLKKLLKHAPECALKLSNHTSIELDIQEFGSKSNTQRRLDVLRAELGDIEELKRELQLIDQAIKEITRRRQVRSEATKNYIKRLLKPMEIKETEEVEKILRRMNSGKPE